MRKFILNEKIALGFIQGPHQVDMLLSPADCHLELEDGVIWAVTKNGRFESITVSSIIQIFLNQGMIREETNDEKRN